MCADASATVAASVLVLGMSRVLSTRWGAPASRWVGAARRTRKSLGWNYGPALGMTNTLLTSVLSVEASPGDGARYTHLMSWGPTNRPSSGRWFMGASLLPLSAWSRQRACSASAREDRPLSTRRRCRAKAATVPPAHLLRIRGAWRTTCHCRCWCGGPCRRFASTRRCPPWAWAGRCAGWRRTRTC